MNNQGKKVLLVANVVKEHVLKFHVPTIARLKEQGWTVDVAASGEEGQHGTERITLAPQRTAFSSA